MYALHPGSLPPKGATDKHRIHVTAEDLVRLYKLGPHDFIVWDPADKYEWFDFIHLYPSYYGNYRLLRDGTPEKDVPCGFTFSTESRAGTLRGSPAATSMRGKAGKR